MIILESSWQNWMRSMNNPENNEMKRQAVQMAAEHLEQLSGAMRG